MTAPQTEDEEPEHWGPAMAALSPRQRAYVLALMVEKPGHGALTAAARAAGYGNREGTTTPKTMAVIAQRLQNNDKVIAAIAEMTKKIIRSEALASIETVREIRDDPLHKDRLKAAMVFVDRVDPVETRHNVEVTHKVVNHDQEAVDTLRYMRSIGASRAALEAHFGFTGLSRYERLLAIEDAAKSAAIEGDFTVVADGEARP
jgi:phage terminase small subunit